VPITVDSGVSLPAQPGAYRERADMTQANISMQQAADFDDLPRTLRRERERQKAAASGSGLAAPAKEYASADATDEDLVPASVKRLDVPFLRLVAFFLKAVLAAIPAIILLGAILWGMGALLKTFFPWLVQAEFIIRLPK
jgi:hypothetical protein